MRLLKRYHKESIFMSIKSSENIKLRGLVVSPKVSQGKTPIAILLHGYMSNHKRMAYIANVLLKNGISVILMDQRGHGLSSGKQNNVDGMQNDLNRLMEYIKSVGDIDQKRILLVGNSLGAFIGLTAGYIHPNITHIIALAGISSPSDLLSGMTRFRRWRWRIIAKLGGIDFYAMRGKTQYSPKIIAENQPNSKKILLFHCINDRLVNVNNFWKNVEAFGITKKNLALFQRGKHGFFLVKDLVVKKIVNWLKDNDF
jgi:alpha-beta hydrolase superfamily lysophospholipase